MESYKDNYLLHYGVKGMKWGVRKAEKRSAQRKQDYQHAKKQAAASRKRVNNLKKSRDDFKKLGPEKAYTEYNDKDFKDIMGYTKKEAFDHELWSYDVDIKNADQKAKTYDKVASEVKNTPLNKKTSYDIARRNKKISKGLTIAGTALGISGSIALGKIYGSSKMALGAAAISGLFGNLFISDIAPTHVDDVYEKRNKSK